MKILVSGHKMDAHRQPQLFSKVSQWALSNSSSARWAYRLVVLMLLWRASAWAT